MLPVSKAPSSLVSIWPNAKFFSLLFYHFLALVSNEL